MTDWKPSTSKASQIREGKGRRTVCMGRLNHLVGGMVCPFHLQVTLLLQRALVINQQFLSWAAEARFQKSTNWQL